MRLALKLGAVLVAAGLLAVAVHRLQAGMLLSQAPAAGGPVNNTAPNITPTTGITVSTVLTCNNGTWTGTVNSSTYQFFGNGTSLGAPASGNTYTVQSTDQGHSITCTQIATGPGGSTTSPQSAPVSVPAATTIGFVSSADLGNNGGTSASYTKPYTIGAGANNRFLVVSILGDTIGGSDDISSVTYAGTAMTQMIKRTTGNTGSNRYSYLYGLAAPQSGANNIVITFASTHYIIPVAADYTGAAQTTPACDGQSTNSGVSITTLPLTFTTTTAGDWGLMTINGGAASGPGMTSDSGYVRRIVDSQFTTISLFDSTTTVTTGAHTVTVSFSTDSVAGLICGLKHG